MIVAVKGQLDTIIWARRAELAQAINRSHRNSDYLPEVELPASLRATNDLEEAVGGADVIVMGVPSHGFRSVLREVAALTGPTPCFVSLTKGIEVDTRKRMSEVIAEEIDGVEPGQISVLTGPNLAREVVGGFPAASTIACADETMATALQSVFGTPTFRCYTNSDVVGCELGGAFKNVIALAAGMSDGLGYGDNTKATVMTRGLAEMARFSVTFGARPLTFLGLAGVGDLMATCSSVHSRNHYVGVELGRGRPIADILASMHQVAEGVKSCKPLLELGKSAGVYMPITENVVRICHEGWSVQEVLADLLAREIRSEFDGLEDSLRPKAAGTR
jgi:glycerol-3-phosphate dehydrogenase (NAD(P)+)